MNRLKIVPTGDRMRRREFLKSSGAAAIVFPWPALAQKDLPLVAVLVPGTADLARQRIDAVRKGLQEAGLAEGVNYAFAPLCRATGMMWAPFMSRASRCCT